MLYSIKLIDTPKTEFNFLDEESRNTQVAALTKKLTEGIEFKSGLNYIVGENGSGKSTLLNIIKSANRCKHSFIPQKDHLDVTTIEELNHLFDHFQVIQDYRIPIFNLYRQKEDPTKHNNLKDLDEFKIHMAGVTESRGQNVLGDINQMFDWMFNRQSECYPCLQIVSNIHNKDSAKVLDSANLLKKFKNNLKIDDPPVYTILMDEPDQGLDIINSKEIYDTISFDKPQTQLIAVVHNPLIIYKLMKSTNAHWIEMSEGYLDKVEKEVEEFKQFLDS